MTSKKKYEVFHPDHETRIGMLLGMHQAINSENYIKLFEESGLQNKQPDDWVSLQQALDIFNILEERGGASLDFVAIGMRIAINAEYPAEFMELSFEEKLHSLVEAYAIYHRGTDVGYAKTRLIEPRHAAYYAKTPFPDDIYYGTVYGLAKRFLPSKMAFKVYYDTEKPRRELGGEETIIHVEWWEKEAK